MSGVYTARQKAVKDQFCLERGKWKWSDTWETILTLNEELLSAYSGLSSVPHKKGALDPGTKELIYLAMDASVTHMYLPGLKRHMVHAMNDLGITPGEIMETLAITSLVGAAAYTDGFPVLMKQLKENGLSVSDTPLSEKQTALREQYCARNRHWDETAEMVLREDPEIFEAYLAYQNAVTCKKSLDAKTRELIFMAVNASPTTRNAEELERHIHLAVEYGASRKELLEVFEVVCCLGIHTVMEGARLLNELQEDHCHAENKE